ncbi:2-dehydropantoate 2-reductase [Psychrobacillus sp. BL-248-WT-3]|uniref:ketopantoate reductase family protein n=1 Tax=Psychrobacillus sp. BL-248-WT-3 TaxID=2725306 RepID=UPI00146A9BFE|nr:2-dehydropantoate 2-reductase [Psychrobacillus sp. BL-248-WT-3]NME05229.1 2-dehydropantoate 2-reductase [Psychrobacillus sp. BL-248-WT-3]
MRIGIIGAGAVGMLFGAYLSKAGHNISFLVRNKSLKELYIKTNDITERIECQIVNSIEALHPMDIIIVAVKYHDLSSLKNNLDSLPKETPLLFIQNGLLHLQFIDTLKQSNILLGSVLHGATKINRETVQHLGIGTTSIGFYKGKWQRLEQLLRSKSEQFPFQLTENIRQILFKKALLNCLINPLTTIARVQNGELIKNESYKKILRSLYEEIIEAFEDWNDLLAWEEVVSLCQNTEYNYSSMLKDFQSNRVMEVDTIVGAILAEAESRKKSLPILNAFYLLLKEMNKVGD